MAFKRREFLAFLGVTAGTVALSPLVKDGKLTGLAMGEEAIAGEDLLAQSAPRSLKFSPVKGPMPLTTDNLPDEQQAQTYSTFAVQDDLVLPEGYTYDLVAAWGDRVGDSRFGYNNDYLSFVPTGPNEGFLSTNHEYISARPWTETFQQVVGKALPFESVKAAVEAAGDRGINAFALPDSDPTKSQIREISREALVDLGVSVISIRKDTAGRWVRTNSNADRVIHGLSGLDNPSRLLKSTGPATAIFRKTSGQGYTDRLGDRIIGTFNNCAGGTTPWGTVFSAEENFQDFVPEPVHADGTSFDPSQKTFGIDSEQISGLSNVFGQAGNKYGWMVEVDPANPADYGTKHTWLGRYRHEAVGIRAVSGRKLAFYSGCDRRGGHLYKFVSRDTVTNSTAKSNSRLLENGMLYAAKFNPDGTGRWIALAPETPVNPDLPSIHVGKMITLPNPDRTAGGIVRVQDDAAIAPYKAQFRTLGDLYVGNAAEKQGAILIDAHFAANAAGATCTARPEDTDVRADGTLFIAFTSGSPSGSDGSPDARVFKGPQGQSPWEFGWIVKLNEDGNDPAAMTFRWSAFAVGGEPAEGGLGFANPDNLEFDGRGNLWVVMDMSSDRLNKAIPAGRKDAEGKDISQSSIRAIYGNNSIWMMPTLGPNAGKAYMFGYGPMDCECTGPFFTRDQRTLFIAVQHPGEVGGVRKDMKMEDRAIAMRTTSGQEFMQTRQVPIGSNWPGKRPNDPPKPAVVAIRRTDGSTLS